MTDQCRKIVAEVLIQLGEQLGDRVLHRGRHVRASEAVRYARDGCIERRRPGIPCEQIMSDRVLQELLPRRGQMRGVPVEASVGLRGEGRQRLVMKRHPVSCEQMISHQVHEDGRNSSQLDRKTCAARANRFLLIAERIDAPMEPHAICKRLRQRQRHAPFQEVTQVTAHHDAFGNGGASELGNETVREKVHGARCSAQPEIALQIGVEVHPVGRFDPRLFRQGRGCFLRETQLRGRAQTMLLEVAFGCD
jgi:hypothetical protein